MKLPFQIISCDLDGTLLNDRMELSRENEEAIHRLTEMGVLFVPNSGRGYGEFPEAIRKNEDIRYCICSDGTVIYDKKTDTRYTTCLDKETYLRVYELLSEYDTLWALHTNNKTYVAEETYNDADFLHYQIGPLTRKFMYDTNLPIPHFDAFCRAQPEIELLCAFFHSDEDRAECRARLARLEGINTVISIPHTLEIIPSAAGKGNTLLRFAERMGIDRAATVALGDSGNDADMLRAAGLGFAMQNAWEELKAVADEVLPCSNEEHVARYLLERYYR